MRREGCCGRSAKKRLRPTGLPQYPLENKFYHFVILLSGLAVIFTGVFMMKRVNTLGIFTRIPIFLAI